MLYPALHFKDTALKYVSIIGETIGLSLPEFAFPLCILKPSNDIFWFKVYVL